MAATSNISVPEGLYPLSSQLGNAIPLDVAAPYKATMVVLDVGGTLDFTLQNDRLNIVSVYATDFLEISTSVGTEPTPPPEPLVYNYVMTATPEQGWDFYPPTDNSVIGYNFSYSTTAPGFVKSTIDASGATGVELRMGLANLSLIEYTRIKFELDYQLFIPADAGITWTPTIYIYGKTYDDETITYVLTPGPAIPEEDTTFYSYENEFDIGIPIEQLRDVFMDVKVGSTSVIGASMAFSKATITFIAEDGGGSVLPDPDTFIAIPNTIYELSLKKNTQIKNLGSTAATVVFNELKRWTQLQNTGAYRSTR